MGLVRILKHTNILSKFSALMCGILLLSVLTVPAFADDPIPTANWTDFYGTVTVEDVDAPIGTVVEAFDPSGVICGRFIVTTAGLYGFMPTYGDDSQTPSVDEGAASGDDIRFTVN